MGPVQLWSVLLLTVAGVVAVRVPWWQIKLAQDQGPNACVVEETPGKNRKYWTECRYWVDRKVCGMKTIIRYECCEGYQQVPGEEGCTGVKPLKNVLETARELGATKFVDYVESAGLTNVLTAEGPMTFFAPIDSAFESMTRSMQTKLNRSLSDPRNPFVYYHLVDRKVPADEFSANLVLVSKYNERPIRISKYSNGMETANCLLIVRKNQQATNGVVHLIEGVLDPAVVSRMDVADIILQDGRFSQLAQMMRQSNFIDKLKSSGQTYTIFAPSDEAFQKIPASRLEKILSDREAREALLDNHVIPHTMCLPAITGDHKMKTTGKNKIRFDCDRRGHTIEDNRIRGDFSLGSNGVIYMLDDIMLPNRAKSLMELATTEKLYTFQQLVRLAGLEDAFEKFGDYTVFVPSEAAMYSMPTPVLTEAKRNPEKARQMVLFHTTQGRHRTNGMTSNQSLRSLDQKHSLRLLVYRKALGVEDAIIETPDIEGMNGVIHVINKVLQPCNESAGDILRKEGNFSIFLEAMERVMNVNPDLDLRKPGSSFTFFVPNDQAFQKMGRQRVQNMMKDTEYLTHLIKNHVVDGMMATESFKPNLYYGVSTKESSVGIVKKKDRITVNDAVVTKSDILNTNGIVHVIDRVLIPENNNVQSGAFATSYSRRGSQNGQSYVYQQSWSSSRHHSSSSSRSHS